MSDVSDINHNETAGFLYYQDLKSKPRRQGDTQKQATEQHFNIILKGIILPFLKMYLMD